MTITVKKTSPDFHVTMAGVPFPSPLGVAAVGNHWGRALYREPENYAEANAGILLKHVRAGAGFIYVTGTFVREETVARLHESARAEERPSRAKGIGRRVLRAGEHNAPYGVEGLYLVTAPFWITAEEEKMATPAREQLMKLLKQKKPADVPIIANCGGLGDLPETYVDSARRWEELGADMVEINLSCPQPPAMKGAVEDFFAEKFPARFMGSLVGDNPDLAEKIIRAVVKAVRIPVGVKLSPENGFPRVVGTVRMIRDAGAKFVQVFNSATGIAPPDIYQRGKPRWPFADGNPFCLAAGSWLRVLCYRDVAAISRFVPGIDVGASGGLVAPEHCIEAMMLGARLTQLCTGIVEQGRDLLRRSRSFLKT
ncbi:MAG: tRNA-dihydrouridine synthase, partial [Chloroflexota bacterium]